MLPWNRSESPQKKASQEEVFSTVRKTQMKLRLKCSIKEIIVDLKKCRNTG